mmetsp:Transcript_38097/g.96799  ORF Transcript_38097/g.96799 Transcript_38097/m.96799 type:complete len:342 (+) Transcript_38097:63-1088(+)
MACLAWLLACPAANTDLTLLSGSWPPRPPQSPSPHAVLLVVPGMKSSVAVARNVVSNVEHMGGQPFSCVVFLYQPALPVNDSEAQLQQVFDVREAQPETQLHKMCTVMRWVGRNVIDYLKLLDAKVTRGFGGGVLVCLDDDVVQFPLHQFLCTARRLQLDVASPAIIRDEADRWATHAWGWPLMIRREYAGVARVVTVVELHVTHFSPRAWACYQSLLDPVLNWGGYGYDVWLLNYMVEHCAIREPIMGIIDGYTATHAHHRLTHNAEVGPRFQPASRNGSYSRVEQMLRMEKAMGERGTPVRHACFYRKDKPCKKDPMLSTESPSNESILQLQNPCTRAT